MVLDILIALILISAMVLGYRAGFVWTFFHMVGWLTSIVLAFLWTPTVRAYLFENTGLYDAFHRTISARFASASSIEHMSADFPRLLSATIDNILNQTTYAASTAITDLLFNIVSFLIVLFAIKLVFFVIILLFSKKNTSKRSIFGVVDGLLGLILGFVKGVLLVFVLLAVMIPVVGFFDGGLVNAISNNLDASFVARSLYDNNFLALIFRDFL